MALPKYFVEDNLVKAKGTSLYGVLIEEMSREELIACVVAGWDAYRQAIKQKIKDVDTLLDMLK